jgi:probable phosphoglycerate mutase
MALSRAGARRRASATPPTLVILVRHGATATTGKELPGRAPGLHLSDVGERQAKAAATRIVALQAPSAEKPKADAKDGKAGKADARTNGKADAKDRRIAAVYASPLERTQETAAPIAEAVGVDVRTDDGLLELDIGDWTGLALSAAMKKPEWRAVQRYPSSFRFPGGESFAEVQARMVDTLARLRAAHPGQAIVAVSHADPIRVAVAHAMGTHLDLFQRIVVSPCSLTALALGDDGPTVLTVNSTDDARSLVPQ